jgi:hypothetical protein
MSNSENRTTNKREKNWRAVCEQAYLAAASQHFTASARLLKKKMKG